MRRIAILLSAYNGSEFIEEQIISIFNQKDVDVRIIIRDDGSTDDTISIIERLNTNNVITLIKGRNIGWKESFKELIKYCFLNLYNDIDYFAFADQDDIWLPNKLINAIVKLEQISYPVKLYCSNLYYYLDGNNLGTVKKFSLKPTIKNCLISNFAVGCTIVGSKELLNILGNDYSRIPVPHDFWVYQTAVLCGVAIFDSDSYILYRQHQNNQIGVKKTFREIWIRRFKNLRKSIKLHQREVQAQELLRCYSQFMNEDSKEAVSVVANYRNSLKTKIRLLFDRGYETPYKSNNIWLKIRIFFSSL